MCPNCRAFITSDDKICPYCQAQVGERVIDRRSPPDVLGGLIPHQRFVTMLILLINTGLYVATMLRTHQQGGSGFGDPSMSRRWWISAPSTRPTSLAAGSGGV